MVKIYELATQKRREAEDSALNFLKEIRPEFEISTNTFSRDHENQLKDMLNRMKEEKAIVVNSITHLEPFVNHFDYNSCDRDVNRNIENIVLIHDLVSIKVSNRLTSDVKLIIVSMKTIGNKC